MRTILLLIADQSAFPLEDSNPIPLFLFLIFYAGVFTGAIIRMISDMRAKHGTDSVGRNRPQPREWRGSPETPPDRPPPSDFDLYNCGKFTLAEDLSDIKDIKSIDLSSISSLEGT